MTDHVVAARLREAREFFGFTIPEVADALGVMPMLIRNYEDGFCAIDGRDLRRLSRLYRRPVKWLCGESTFQPSADLAAKLDRPDITDRDRDAILAMAEFLETSGPPPAFRRQQDA